MPLWVRGKEEKKGLARILHPSKLLEGDLLHLLSLLEKRWRNLFIVQS